MVNAISNNALIAALFGVGTARPLRSASATSSSGAVQPTASPNVHLQPVDSVEISSAGERADATSRIQEEQVAQPGNSPTGLGGEIELTGEERQEVKELEQGDAEVRRHEAAHKAAAGTNVAGGPTFEYTTGPDGRRYAVGGEVQIDTSEVKGDPQATIQKMHQIRRAALAPASPSGQDRAVAAQAAATERSARAELAKARRVESSSTDDQRTGSTMVQDAPSVTGSSKSSSQPSDATARPRVTTQLARGLERIGEILDVIA